MALNPIIETLRQIWNLWSIRGCVTLSLSLQIFIFLFASLRRKTGSTVVYFLIWSAYLLADWIPTFTVGLILKSLSTSTTSSSVNSSTGPPGHDDDLLALWAASLLWHLGGSFGITAFALEDNELWYRHSIVTVAQFATAIYIFLRTLPHNKLIIPTVFALLGGFFSNVLRVYSMRLASLDKYREDIVAELDSPDGADTTHSLNKLDKKYPLEPLHRLDVLLVAHHYFKFFKGLVVNMKRHPDEQKQIKEVFCKRISPEDAYQIISCELSYMYEVFYTSSAALTGTPGVFFRYISFALSAVVLGRFVHTQKQDFHPVDIRISNALVTGSFLLSLMMPSVPAYREKSMVIFPQNTKGLLDLFTRVILSLRVLIQHVCKSIRLKEPEIRIKPDIRHKIDGTPVFLRQWSESICSYNLISYCLKERPRVISRPYRPFAARIFKIPHVAFQTIGRVLLVQGKLSIIIFRYVLNMVGLKDILDRAMYVSRHPFDKDLWDFIFNNLRDASTNNDENGAGKLISQARGGWALQNCDHSTKLLHYIEDVEYHQRLLLWHIATELCYNAEDDGDLPCSVNAEDDGELSDGETSNNRVFSKMLSDYMLYLMVFRPRLMSTVSASFLRAYEPICKRSSAVPHKIRSTGKDVKLKEALGSIRSNIFSDQPDFETGIWSTTLTLFSACTLSDELMQLAEKERWTVLSRVWLEMLVYAAKNCRGDIHARTLCRGGEFLTLVWLLMAHFGLM